MWVPTTMYDFGRISGAGRQVDLPGGGDAGKVDGTVWAGRLAAFAGSAALHAWIVLVAVGPEAVVPISVFFMIQAAVVALERRFRVDRWPPAGAHAWTVVMLLGTSSLFIEPTMGCSGLSPPWAG